MRPVGSMDSGRYCDVKVDVVLGADNIQIQEQFDVRRNEGMLVLRIARRSNAMMARAPVPQGTRTER